MTDHTTSPFLAKSFVPGVGYKTAKELSDVERHMVRNKSAGNAVKFKRGLTPEKTAPKSTGRLIHGGADADPARDAIHQAFGTKLKDVKTPRTGKTLLSRRNEPVHVPGAGGTLHPLLAQAFPDGKGGGLIRSYGHGADKTTMKHEKAHITPKRNPVRFRERALSDPKRNGREEGRADFIAHGKATPGNYPGEAKFQEGYNEVQTKMGQAAHKKSLREPKKRERKFVVDSKGTTTVKKCAFGVVR